VVTQTVDRSVAAGRVCQALDDLATEFVGPGRRPAGRFCGGVFCGLGGAGEWSCRCGHSLPVVRPSVRGMIRWSPDLQDQSLAPDPVPPVSDPMYSIDVSSNLQ